MITIMTKHVIAIIGTIGAGKDTAGDYLAKQLGIPSYQISAPLKEICLQSGLEPTRENLIALGTRLAKERGDGYLARYIIERMPERAIITGIRQLGQIEELRSHANLTIIAIDASPALRFERIKKNGKIGEASSLDEFVARELAENSPPNAQRLFECMELSDTHLQNEGDLDELYAQLNLIISKYG